MDCFILRELQEIHDILKEMVEILKEIRDDKEV